MKMNIETYASNKYEEISEEYGTVLSRFGLTETEDGNAEVYIGCLGDLLNLNKELEEFTSKSDKVISFFNLIGIINHFLILVLWLNHMMMELLI